MNRTLYPSDVSDEEWSFVAAYLTLITEDAPQREHDLREVFNGVRWMVRTGAQWRMIPHDLPWSIVYQQALPWLKAGYDSRHHQQLVGRVAAGCNADPSAAIFVEPCNRRQKVATEQAMMEPSGAKAVRSTQWWTRRGICWLGMSPWPMSTIEPRWENWLKRCKK